MYGIMKKNGESKTLQSLIFVTASIHLRFIRQSHISQNVAYIFSDQIATMTPPWHGSFLRAKENSGLRGDMML
jgi:hypothetical protein